ncbi:MAG: hypothetical protein ACOCUY_00185 [Verrucomicrobiota bacterium]
MLKDKKPPIYWHASKAVRRGFYRPQPSNIRRICSDFQAMRSGGQKCGGHPCLTRNLLTAVKRAPSTNHPTKFCEHSSRLPQTACKSVWKKMNPDCNNNTDTPPSLSISPTVVRVCTILMAVVVTALLLDETGPLEGWMGPYTPSSETPQQPPSGTRSQQPKEPTQSDAAYAPAPESTPEEMRPAVQAFSEWLEMQHRRVGGKIADRVSADRQGGRAVLYLTVDPDFLEQERGLRMQIAEGVWRYWAERATAACLARRLGAAHVVFLDSDSEIIGGSKPSSASTVWMQRN